MHYISTRGDPAKLSFEQAVLAGLAPDGGLYIPSYIPTLPADWQTAWQSYTFPQLSHALLSLFIPESEIPSADLKALIEASYSTFRHPDVTPVHKIRDNAFVLELFHGPTFAFKDVALQLLGNLFEYFLKRRNTNKAPTEQRETLTILGATSGDTGSAAIYGLRNKADISIFILHPKGRVSPIQEAQMTTVTDANVHNVAVKATFDDCQDIVKTLFANKEFNTSYRLGAVNSINWARILAQTVYYFLGYFHVRRQTPADASLQFVVPTGNFGDVLAGWYAKRLGLPMAQLGVATNENDILARFWRSGRYEKQATVPEVPTPGNPTGPTLGSSDGKQRDGSGVKETLSPAMDILVSSNFERLLWYLAYESVGGQFHVLDEQKRVRASQILSGWMEGVKKEGRAVMPTEILELARKDFVAERISDEQTLETIKNYFISAVIPYIADPHTAVGLAAAETFAQSNTPNTYQIILSTAHPAKFSEAVTRALGSSINFEKDVLPLEFKGLLDRPRRVIDVEAPDAELVKKVIEEVVGKSKSAGGPGGSI